MDTLKMREEFETQLKDVSFKIKKGEEELLKLKEYKLKVEGGLDCFSSKSRVSKPPSTFNLYSLSF